MCVGKRNYGLRKDHLENGVSWLEAVFAVNDFLRADSLFLSLSSLKSAQLSSSDSYIRTEEKPRELGAFQRNPPETVLIKMVQGILKERSVLLIHVLFKASILQSSEADLNVIYKEEIQARISSITTILNGGTLER